MQDWKIGSFVSRVKKIATAQPVLLFLRWNLCTNLNLLKGFKEVLKECGFLHLTKQSGYFKSEIDTSEVSNKLLTKGIQDLASVFCYSQKITFPTDVK